MLKTTLGLLLTAGFASAALTYNVTNLGMASPFNCDGLASNGNVACSNQFYNAATGVTSTISGLPALFNMYTNAAGEIAGNPNTNAAGYFYNGSTVVTLPVPATTNYVSITGIDNAGDISGSIIEPGVGQYSIIWNTSGASIAYTLNVGNTASDSISPDGTVAYSAGSSDYLYSLSTGASTLVDNVGFLHGVGDSGEVAGGSWNSNYTFFTPYIASAGSFIEPCTSPANCSGANAPDGANFLGVNASGQAVGYNIGAAQQHAFLYSGGAMLDLNSLIASGLNTLLGGSGWYLYEGIDINDSGQILALAYNGSTEADVLLTPAASAPEPGTLGLFCAGTALLYFASRRRRRRNV
jgi:probable HAF family extracellular repeat protein